MLTEKDLKLVFTAEWILGVGYDFDKHHLVMYYSNGNFSFAEFHVCITQAGLMVLRQMFMYPKYTYITPPNEILFIIANNYILTDDFIYHRFFLLDRHYINYKCSDGEIICIGADDYAVYFHFAKLKRSLPIKITYGELDKFFESYDDCNYVTRSELAEFSDNIIYYMYRDNRTQETMLVRIIESGHVVIAKNDSLEIVYKSSDALANLISKVGQMCTNRNGILYIMVEDAQKLTRIIVFSTINYEVICTVQLQFSLDRLSLIATEKDLILIKEKSSLSFYYHLRSTIDSKLAFLTCCNVSI